MARNYRCVDCVSYVLDPDNHCSNPDPCVSYSRFKLAPKKPKYTEDDAMKLATVLHEEQCTANHTDQCGWCYEAWDGKGWTKERYLKIAKKMLNKHPMETIVDIIKMLGKF